MDAFLLSLIVFLVCTVLELGAHLPLLWNLRRGLTILLVPPLGVSAGLIAALEPNPLSLLFALASLYRCLNILRLAEARMHEGYLRKATWRNSVLFSALQAISLSLWYILIPDKPDWRTIVLGLAATQAAVTALLLATTLYNLWRSRPRTKSAPVSDKSLPTLTVAIPARNETDALQACLQRVIANDYPKLEILVYDDCSQDKTSDIIKHFAQKGVRFIAGEEPSDSWLAKNQAYDAMADQASGELLLFVGVDVQLGPESLRRLVEEFLERKKEMLSIMPYRPLNSPLATLVQPMRYFWELALPRWQIARPPVLSTCWLIKKTALKKFGGFDAVSRMVVPESYFARELHRDALYDFLRAGDTLQIETRKALREQYETAVRTRYPQVHKRPVSAMLIALAEFLFLFGPFAMLVVGLLQGVSELLVLGALASTFLTITHLSIVAVSSPANWWLALLSFPFVILLDIAIIHISMWQYEFGEVRWKARNVCLPVMHAIPHLPKI